MTFIKKGLGCLFACLMLFSLIYVPEVQAKTVGDVEAELKAKQIEAEKNQQDLKYTESQIAATKSNINRTYSDIAHIQDDMIAKTKEIEELNNKINGKNDEIKELVGFIQISQGSNEYLEYIAGADTMTDFIYRLSITEQLLQYNKDMIAQMNTMIKDNENKKIELNKQKGELKNKQVYLGQQLTILGQDKKDMEDYSQSLSDEIKTAQEVLKIYKDAGCKSTDNVTTCTSKILPIGTAFWRPLTTGYITSNYGERHLEGTSPFHYAVDISTSNKYNVNVFAVATGKVMKVIRYDGSQSGGNQVIIHHTIRKNGVTKTYTSWYCHLASIKVKAEEIVTKDTVVGIMGNTGNSRGAHLHLSIGYGLWYAPGDYSSYDVFTKVKNINPRELINFPSGTYTTWYNRTTAY